MKLTNIHGFDNIDSYVKYKIAKYAEMPKNFESLFDLMFDETDNTMIETSDGYRVARTTYGEYKQKIINIARLAIIVLSIAFIIHGTYNGGASDVYQKAINICTECIGLG